MAISWGGGGGGKLRQFGGGGGGKLSCLERECIKQVVKHCFILAQDWC